MMEPEHRRDPRYNVAVGASYSNGADGRSLVKVTNVSARGCRFVSERRLEPRAAIVVSFGRAATLDAKVRWRVGKVHGIRFAEALDQAALDHIRLFLSEEPALVAEREPVAA
jgi:hypothetical protein